MLDFPSDSRLVQCSLPYRGRVVDPKPGDSGRWVTRINCDKTTELVSRSDALRQVALFFGTSVAEASVKFKRGSGLVQLRFCTYEF